MIPVAEARSRIVGRFAPLPAEIVPLSAAAGRVLARDMPSRLTQPPLAVSAMDGYAVRAADTQAPGARLRPIGEAPAGTPFDGEIGPGETVRIFTGGPVPAGADAILIQENAEPSGDAVIVAEPVAEGRYIRPAGLDFSEGEILLQAGRVLRPRDIGLAAAANAPWLPVVRKPVVAILATGDEIVLPGDPVGPGRIVSSNSWALAAFVERNGGVAQNLGIAGDDPAALQDAVRGMGRADLLVTTGGASVGEHDLIRPALGEIGLKVDFWKIAMRPGKPLIFGALERDEATTPFLGLPGNPVSALVCALMFMAPVMQRMLGRPAGGPPTETAALGADLPANDEREDYLRATLSTDDAGRAVATPFAKQDSSMLSRLAAADALIVRPPRAGPAAAGDSVAIIPLSKDPAFI